MANAVNLNKLFTCETMKYVVFADKQFCLHCASIFNNSTLYSGRTVCSHSVKQLLLNNLRAKKCYKCNKTLVFYCPVTNCDSCYEFCTQYMSSLIQKQGIVVEDNPAANHQLYNFCTLTQQSHIQNLLQRFIVDVNYLNKCNFDDLHILSKLTDEDIRRYDNSINRYKLTQLREAAKRMQAEKETVIAALQLIDMNYNHKIFNKH